MISGPIELLCQQGGVCLNVCLESGCRNHPFTCTNAACSCKESHRKHQKYKLKKFIKVLEKSSNFDSDVPNIESALTDINMILHRQIDAIYFRHRNQWARKKQSHHRTIRDELINTGRLSRPVTGNDLSELLKIVEHGIGARNISLKELLASYKRDVNYLLKSITAIEPDRRMDEMKTPNHALEHISAIDFFLRPF
jgi:hypothetical protein